MGKIRNAYEILGVARTATPKEILDAWRILARALHPDKNGSTAKATADFAELSCAYNILIDPKTRKQYDLESELLTDPCKKCDGTGVVATQKGFTQKVKSTCTMCRGVGRVARQS
jgi:DnaJ-class molecular chaperone